MSATPLVTPPRRRGRWLVWLIVAVGVVFAIEVAAVGQTFAALGYDSARDELGEAVASARGAHESAAQLDAAATAAFEQGERIIDGAGDTVDPAARDTFTSALAQVGDARAGVARAASADIPRPPEEKPFWVWELVGQTQAMTAATVSAREIDRTEADAASDLQDLRGEMDAAAAELFASVPAFATALESASISAQTKTVIEVRRRAADLATRTELDETGVDAFTVYADAVAAMRASHDAERAEKSGALFDRRLAAEEFARSLSGDVLLDFDWAPIVIGYGAGDSMAGTAVFADSDYGPYATITLTDSVARLWPSARSQALVAHEVGHAVATRCSTLFDWTSDAEHEEWATAWAISMGFTNDANGVQAYGYPSQAMLDRAATCR